MIEVWYCIDTADNPSDLGTRGKIFQIWDQIQNGGMVHVGYPYRGKNGLLDLISENTMCLG